MANSNQGCQPEEWDSKGLVCELTLKNFKKTDSTRNDRRILIALCQWHKVAEWRKGSANRSICW